MLQVSSGQLEKWNRLLDSAKPEQLIFEDVEGEENGAQGVDLDDDESEELEEGENDLDGEEEEESESEEGAASSGSNSSGDFGREKTSAYR